MGQFSKPFAAKPVDTSRLAAMLGILVAVAIITAAGAIANNIRLPAAVSAPATSGQDDYFFRLPAAVSAPATSGQDDYFFRLPAE